MRAPAAAIRTYRRWRTMSDKERLALWLVAQHRVSKKKKALVKTLWKAAGVVQRQGRRAAAGLLLLGATSLAIYLRR